MALLLAMYQKMRLIREKNQLIFDQTKIEGKLKRVQKSIERTQKRYTSIFANLESQSKMMTSKAKYDIQAMFGLDVSGSNIYNYGGLTDFVLNGAMKLCEQGKSLGVDSSNEPLPVHTIENARFQEMYQIYIQNGCTFPQDYDEDPTTHTRTPKTDTSAYYGKEMPVYQNGIQPEDVALFNMAIQYAKQMQQQTQQQANQLSSNYEGNVSIWLEHQKAYYEAEQDAILEPLNYEQTMLELEKEQRDTRLKQIQESIQTYEQLVSQEVKSTTPNFGLG